MYHLLETMLQHKDQRIGKGFFHKEKKNVIIVKVKEGFINKLDVMIEIKDIVNFM